MGLLFLGCSSNLQESDISLTLTHDPFNTAPLSAQAKIAIPNQPVNITVSVLGRHHLNSSNSPGITISHTFSNRSGIFTLPVLGLYPNYTNQVELTFKENEHSLTLIRELVTPPLDTNQVIPIEIFINQLPPQEAEVLLVDNTKIAFDQLGEIRWAYTGNSFLNYGKFQNGNLIISSGEDLLFQYHYPEFYEVSMLGETIRTYDISAYYGHHDVWEIRTGPHQGDLLVGVNEQAPIDEEAGDDGVGEEDYIILIDRKTGEVMKEWDLKKLFDSQNPEVHRIPMSPTTHPDDWIHMNSLYHDPEDNSIVFSSRHLSAVVKFDFESEELIWIITDNTSQNWSYHTNHLGQVIADYVLTPIDKTGKVIDNPGAVNFWPYGQHAATRIGGENGFENILLYDNGNHRNYFQFNNNRKKEFFSRTVEYRLNRNTMTVEKVWEFDADKKYYTIATGGVDLLPNGNRLNAFMWITKNKNTPRVIELDPEGKVVFEARFNQGRTFYYQVEKFNLYQGLD